MNQSERPPSHGEATRPADWSNERWDEFYRQNRLPLYQLIRRNPGLSRDHHDEVYADACSALWEARGRLDPTRPIYPYARRIALNTARTKIRRQSASRRGQTKPVGADDQVADHRRAGLQLAVGREQQRAIRKYLDGLPPIARLILEARGLERLSWDEVAAKVQLPRTTVVRLYGSLVSQARIALAAWAS
jgi:RNA polymerase sigma factor (sigma-70 family)